MRFEQTSDLEGLRIPHFYSAFYVYKYATGISAAIALSDKVLQGTDADRDQYLNS
jgi:oligoendopeptidase F